MLPPDTERVWKFVENQPVLAGFVLVGGSALALRIGHRVSEDLDLVCVEPRLPRQRIEALCHLARAAGFEFKRNDDEARVLEFADAGLALHDYQQNFLVNGATKVSCFTPDPPLAKVLTEAPGPAVRVATLAELFKSKCLVSALRSKTRDWVDLYLLLRDHGFTMRDYQAAFVEAGVGSQCDIGLSRLCSGVPQKDDEGYAHLLPIPPTLTEMKTFFNAQRDQFEVELATDALRRRQQAGGQGSGV